MTVAELQARISSREFAEWIAFAQTEPIGGVRGDVQAATVATMIANAYRDSKKRSEPYSVAELVHVYWPAPEDAGEVAEREPGPGAGPRPRLRSPDGALRSDLLWAKVKTWAVTAKKPERERGYT